MVEATLSGFVPRGPSVEAHPGQSSDRPLANPASSPQRRKRRPAEHRCGPPAQPLNRARPAPASSQHAPRKQLQGRFSTFLETTLMLSMFVRIKHLNRHILRSVPRCPSETAFLRGCLRTVISDSVFRIFTVPPAHSILLSALSAGYEDLEKSTEQGPGYLWSIGQRQVYKARYRLFA